jgi:hypothetical protein
MTNVLELVRGLFLLIPIGILFSIGGLIALNSGTNQPDAGYALRRYAGNLGSLLLHLCCVLALLLVVQQWVGLGLKLGR